MNQTLYRKGTNGIVLALQLIIVCFGVKGSSTHQCSTVTKINCSDPGLKPKDCFCGCLNASINRAYLKVDYSPCIDLLSSCPYYTLSFSIRFTAEDHTFVAGKEEAIHLGGKSSSKIIPVYQLTNIHDPKDQAYSEEHYIKLQTDKKYIVSIQPKCTICDRCSYIKDMVIPAVKIRRHHEKESPLAKDKYSSVLVLSVTIPVSIFIVILSLVLLIVILFRRRRDLSMISSESPALMDTGNGTNNQPNV